MMRNAISNDVPVLRNENKSYINVHSVHEARNNLHPYKGADKSLARPTYRCILFDGKNISFNASLVIYIVLIFLQL